MSWFDVDSAFAEMEVLSRQLDALLDQRGLDGRHGLRLFSWNGGDNMFVEEGDDLVWRGDVPGVSKEEVDVNVSEGLLTITAKRTQTDQIDGKGLRHRERRPFELERSWTLPDTVDADNIGASLEDGVLTLRLPKRPQTKPRQIEIR